MGEKPAIMKEGFRLRTGRESALNLITIFWRNLGLYK